jgi:hypothetical protein
MFHQLTVKFNRISKLMEMHIDHLQKFNRNLYLNQIHNNRKLKKIFMKCQNILKIYNKYKKMVNSLILMIKQNNYKLKFKSYKKKSYK